MQIFTARDHLRVDFIVFYCNIYVFYYFVFSGDFESEDEVTDYVKCKIESLRAESAHKEGKSLAVHSSEGKSLAVHSSEGKSLAVHSSEGKSLADQNFLCLSLSQDIYLHIIEKCREKLKVVSAKKCLSN